MWCRSKSFFQFFTYKDGFGFWFFDPGDLSTVVVAPTTCSLTTCLLLVLVYPQTAENWALGVPTTAENPGWECTYNSGENFLESRGSVENFAEIAACRKPQERLSAGQWPYNLPRCNRGRPRQAERPSLLAGGDPKKGWRAGRDAGSGGPAASSSSTPARPA